MSDPATLPGWLELLALTRAPVEGLRWTANLPPGPAREAAKARARMQCGNEEPEYTCPRGEECPCCCSKATCPHVRAAERGDRGGFYGPGGRVAGGYIDGHVICDAHGMAYRALFVDCNGGGA